MIRVKKVGKVISKFDKNSDPLKMQEEESIIEIKKKYCDALFRIEESEFLEIVFVFDKAKNYKLKTTNYYGEYKGVFATRTPFRPTNIGISRVKLLKREGNRLYVKGLDALNNTPVIDIKPYSIENIFKNNEEIILQEKKEFPRKELIQLVKNNKLEDLLILSAGLHGHYCPGLSLGVLGATYAINKIREFTEGFENLLAIAEVNSCLVDAVQLITGCTIGNNSLIYRDIGKIAFSLVNRNGKGVRLSIKSDYREKQKERYPDFTKYFDLVIKKKSRDEENLLMFKKLAKEASFDLLKWDINEIFNIKEININIPEFAPIRESVFCIDCKEPVMKGKEIIKEEKIYCRYCAKDSFMQLNGEGIKEIHYT